MSRRCPGALHCVQNCYYRAYIALSFYCRMARGPALCSGSACHPCSGSCSWPAMRVGKRVGGGVGWQWTYLHCTLGLGCGCACARRLATAAPWARRAALRGCMVPHRRHAVTYRPCVRGVCSSSVVRPFKFHGACACCTNPCSSEFYVPRYIHYKDNNMCLHPPPPCLPSYLSLDALSSYCWLVHDSGLRWTHVR